MVVAVGIAAVATLHLAAGFCLAVWLGYGPPTVSAGFRLLLGDPPLESQSQATQGPTNPQATAEAASSPASEQQADDGPEQEASARESPPDT
ncbi:MAG: hypothetical protein D6741_10250 [Planctomycetota bacterium]|nr:MAG: hypothetical protein D6741_10250 [Planctomycetota bacterium]